MKGILLLVGMLALAGLPASAGVNISVNFGGGGCRYPGNYFAAGGARCAYTTGCYNPYRSCGYVGYPGYGYGYYGGYVYGGYAPAYYPVVTYDTVSYASLPPPAPPVPAPQAATPTPVPAPAPTPTPAPAPMEFGILDVNGFVHSPYSDAIFKVPNVRTAQMVYDPVTGKPFLVR